MGDIKSLMNMIPGVGKLTKDVDIDDKAFKKVESIIYSMTPKERKNPELLNMSRKTRIAKGCGQNLHEINAFMKQFEEMRKMMKMMNKMSNARISSTFKKVVFSSQILRFEKFLFYT